tara:strand:+ start:440 stop:865 length:426 start_codon:yes stop_codon:yes gene_type:complete
VPDFNETDEPVAFDDATGLPHSKTTRADEEPLGSLFDDAYALYEDGRTYLEAEVAFQKSRATYAAHESKSGIVFAMAAMGLLHLALLGLVVGLIIALEPFLGAFGAMGVVVGALTVLGVLLALMARGRFKRITRAFEGDGE